MSRGGTGWVLVALLLAVGCGTDSDRDRDDGAHPRSSASCAECHAFGAGDESAPKVIPAVPAFAVPLLGENGYRGHPSLSCAGTVENDGTITGCHRIEAGLKSYLVVDVDGVPVDEFCGRCHGGEGQLQRHHPSYLYDADWDGTADRLAVPPPTQRVFSDYAPSGQAEPLSRYPDALVIDPVAGAPQVTAVLPLESLPDPFADPVVIVDGVVTCTSCHNPHYGYAVSSRNSAELDEVLGNSSGGDYLLRLRPNDNTLCNACHGLPARVGAAQP